MDGFTVKDMEADETFKKMSLDDQRRTRENYFNEFVASDPLYANASYEDKALFEQGFYGRAPVFADESDTQVQEAKALTEQVRLGNADARSAVKGRLFAQSATRDSVVANVLVGAYDIVDELWNPGSRDYANTYGKEGQKIAAMHARALEETATDPNEIQSLRTWSAITGTVLGLAESFATYGGLVGTLGRAGKLTGGMMTRLASVAGRMESGAAQRLVASAGEQTIQALVGGALSATQSVLMDGFQGGWDTRGVENAMKQLGPNVALDYAMWLGMSALGVSAKVTRAMFKEGGTRAAFMADVKRTPEALQRELVKTALSTGELAPALLEQLDAETAKIVQKQFADIRAMSNAGALRTPEDYGRVLALSKGFQLDKSATGTWLAREVGSDTVVAEAKSVNELVNGIMRDVAPGGLKRAAPVARVKAIDTFELSKIDRLERGPVYGQLLREGDGAGVKLAVGDMTGLKTVEMPDMFGQGASLANTVERDDVLTRATLGALGGKDPVVALGEVSPLTPIRKRELLVTMQQAAVAKGTIFVPKEGFQTLEQARLYLGALDKSGSLAKVDPGLRDSLWRTFYSKASPLTQTTFMATKRLAERVAPRSTLETLQGGVMRLVESDGHGGKTVLHAAESHTEMRAFLVDKAIADKTVTFEDMQYGIAKMTGLRLTKETATLDVQKRQKLPKGAQGPVATDVGYDRYVLRATSVEADKRGHGKLGAELDSASTLEEMLSKHPELKDALRLPASFGPSLYVVDESLGKLAYEGTMASGRLVDLMAMSDEYMKPLTGNMNPRIQVGHIDGEPVWLDSASRRYVYARFEGATERTYASLDTLKNEMARRLNTLDDTMREAHARGLSAHVGRDGTLSLIGKDNYSKTFKNEAELREFLKSTPVMHDAPELVPYDGWAPDRMVALDAEMTRRAELAYVKPGTVKKLSIVQRILHPMAIMQYLAPAEATMAAHALRTGIDAPLKAFRAIQMAKRLMNVDNRSWIPYIEEIGQGYNVVQRKRLGTALSIPEADRDRVLATLGVTLTATDKLRLKKAETFLDVFLKTRGLGDVSSFVARKEELNAFLQGFRDDGGLMTAHELLEKHWGPSIPKAMELYTEGMSGADLRNAMAESDISYFMTATVDKVNKLLYLKPILPQLARTFKTVQEAVDKGVMKPSALSFFRETLNDAYGIRTSAGEVLSETTEAFSQKLVRVLQKSPLLENIGIPQEVDTDDLLSKLGEIFTVNSQAWRVWAVPRNLTQVTLLGSVIGNGRMWKAFQYVLDNRSYVDELYSRGAMQESIMAMGDEALTPLKKLAKMGLHPMERSDAITRATCVRAAEVAIEETRARFAKGLVKGDGVLRELQADFLEAPDQTEVLRLFRERPEAAADFLGQAWQKATMFDYSRGASGSVSRGVVGRLFGKLSVYPLHQIELYRKILANGDPAARAARATRLVATTTALYAVCQAVGIDYSGFLATDPFSFSGGPYWTAMNDALNSIGSQPENAVARSRLARNVPRMVIPGAMFAPYKAKADAAAEDGDMLRWFYAMTTTPAVKQEGLLKPMREIGNMRGDGMTKIK